MKALLYVAAGTAGSWGVFHVFDQLGRSVGAW